MALTREEYRPRIIDNIIDDYLAAFGAIAIEGPKFCGKTWTSLNHANSVFYVADPANNYANRTQALYDPYGVLKGEKPRALDEWQEAKGIWDAVRFSVDSKKGKGHYILTGSSTPEDTGAKDASVLHSGTGRIAHIAMRTMSLYETGHSSGKVSLKDLIDGRNVALATSRLSLDGLVDLLVAGGWPENLDVPQRIAGLLPRQYLLNIANIDISRIDNIKRDPMKILALLASIARNTGNVCNSKTLSADIAQHSDEEAVSSQSVLAYIKLLRCLYMIEEIPGWAPALRSPVRLRNTPRRYLADPSLAVAAMQANHQSLIDDRKTLGFVFENLVIRDLLIYSQVHDAQIQYYLDDAQLDCDAILSLGDERWAAFEIKLGSDQENAAATRLLKLANKMVGHGTRAPLFTAVITGLGTTAHKRDDGVYCIPIDTLKP
jgi:predicted AAA+ superfamily ATPase